MTARRPDNPGAAGPTAPTTGQGGHLPVMVGEVIEALAPRDSAIYLDGTFGAGGYSRAILDAANCRVWAIDQDQRRLADVISTGDWTGYARSQVQRGLTQGECTIYAIDPCPTMDELLSG